MKIAMSAALAAACFVALAGCQKATDSTAFENEAKEDVRKFIPALNTGDVDTMLTQYAADAEVLAPGSPRATGHEAIRAQLEKESAAIKSGGVTLELKDDDKAAASGDLGYHSGSFVVKDASGAVVDSGKYLAVMQRQPDGKWLMIRDTWNSDNPPPAPAAAPPTATDPAMGEEPKP